MSATFVLTGSYTAATGGRGAGVVSHRQDPGTGVLTPVDTLALPSPSYLAAHPVLPVVYAALEFEDAGEVACFRVGPDGTMSGHGDPRPTSGGAPCHLSVDPLGRFLFTANYGDGSVVVHPLAADGAPGPASAHVAFAGHGPDPDRQAGPHAHQALLTPSGDWLVVTDLGTDTLHHLCPGPGGTLQQGPAVALPPGTGPRHLAFGPGGHAWAVGELDPVVIPLGTGQDGTLRPAGKPVPAAGPAPEGVRNHPSAIAASPDGRFLYVGNRGPDTVSVLSVPALAVVGEVPAGGAHPRDVAVLGEEGGFVYVAAQESDVVTVFRRDPVSGLLGGCGVVVATGSPTCVLPVHVS